MGKSVRAFGDTSGAKAQNVEWFSTDITSDDIGKFRFNVSVDTAVVVQITKDGGTTWVNLNRGNNLGVDDESVFSIPIRNGDEFNVRTPTAGGATINYCRVDFITDEG